MADTKMFPVSSNFDIVAMVEKLTQTYRTKGFEVTSMKSGTGYSVTFSKDEEGIKKFVGLGLEITANLSVNENSLIVNFSGAEWTGKIIGLVVGWILCFIPFCIAIYGSVKQSNFPKDITQDIQMIIPNANRTMPSGAAVNSRTESAGVNNTENTSPRCPACGNELKSTAKFCPKCGTKVSL